MNPIENLCVTNVSQAATYSDKIINRNIFYFFETTKYKQKPKMVWSRKLYHPTIGERANNKRSLSPPPSFLLYQRHYFFK
jgi:hypothetical protein